MIKALETMENRDRAFEDDDDSNGKALHGVRRRVERTRDVDEIYESLRHNWLLVLLGTLLSTALGTLLTTVGALFKRDVANLLKERFGNLSMTVDRILVGLAGGASILVPMIIMVFATSMTARLICVSVATIVFANFVALTSVSKENVVAATAAYAAVMVVFIGNAAK